MRVRIAIVLAALVAIVAMSPLAAQDAAPPTLISIEGGRVAHSGVLSVDIVGNTFPKGFAGFSIRVSTADPTIAVPLRFGRPDYGLTDLDATSTPGSLRLAVVDLNSLIEVGATSTVLGTVAFLGKAEGITAIRLSVERMDDEDGFPVLTSVSAGLLTVTNPRDLDGDGITEDINGNGLFDFGDVLDLLRMLLATP